MASIVTTRLIMIISATIMTQMASYYVARPCYQLAFMMGPRRALRSYPDCQAYFNGTNEQQHVAVQALMSGGAAQPSGVAAALGASFGSSLWLAFALHAIGIEIYVSNNAAYRTDTLANGLLATLDTCRERPPSPSLV